MHALRRRQEQIPCELEAHACDHDRDRDLGYGLCLAFLLDQSHGPFDLGFYLGHDGRGLRLGSRTVSTRCSPPHLARLPQASRRASGRPAAAYRWWSACTQHGLH